MHSVAIKLISRGFSLVERKYYSQRKANNSALRISLESLVGYFDEIHTIFYNRGHFYHLPSSWDADINLYSIEIFNKEDMLPFHKDNDYSEEDIFDLIEFFHDSIEISETVHGKVVTSVNKIYLQGMANVVRDDVEVPTKKEVQSEYRTKINRVISKYGVGYELTEEGYIREIVNNGLEELIDSPHVLINDTDSELRIKYAKKAFFSHGATEEDKRGAIFEIGAVLEKLRDSEKLNLNSKDENELFTILNRFNIRHNRKDQLPNYDKEVFYPWIFYNLLAAIDASIKLQRQ